MTKQTCLLASYPRMVLVAGAALLLATACGRDESTKKKPVRVAEVDEAGSRPAFDRPLPSATAEGEKKIMTSASPVPMPRGVDESPVAEEEPTKKMSYRELIREGKRLAGEGMHSEAMEALEQAAEMKPKAALPRIEIARALIVAGKHAEARGHAEAAVEITPSSSYAWNTLGRVELGEGEMEAAIASFERATDENADNSYAWNNLGLVMLGLERYEEAASALEMATSGGNPKAYMWNNLGMAYEHLDRLVEARAAYRQAADAGSKKGEASLIRLEGVTSLEHVEIHDLEVEGPNEIALDFPHDGE